MGDEDGDEDGEGKQSFKSFRSGHRADRMVRTISNKISTVLYIYIHIHTDN